jgi:hypothetical protein
VVNELAYEEEKVDVNIAVERGISDYLDEGENAYLSSAIQNYSGYASKVPADKTLIASEILTFVARKK